MMRDQRIKRVQVTCAAWFAGLALSGGLGVPFWRDHPYGDGFDISLTFAVLAWLVFTGLVRPYRITRIDVDRDGVTVTEAPQ